FFGIWHRYLYRYTSRLNILCTNIYNKWKRYNITKCFFIYRYRKAKIGDDEENKGEDMKLPDTEIRSAIISRLNGVISQPVRDSMARPNDEPPYILLSTQTSSQIPVKDRDFLESTILIQIRGSQNITVHRYEVEQITEDIMNELLPISPSNYIPLTDFNIVSILLDSLNDDVITNDEGVTARKLLRLRLRLS